jgi:hypothetical protein
MTSPTSFRSNWTKMSLPPNQDALTIKPVSGTNAYLAKDYNGSLGLFLRDVSDSLPRRNYKHIEIEIHARKNLHIPGRGIQNLTNCLILMSDSHISSAALSLVLEGLHDHCPSGIFNATSLIQVLDEVEELLRKPKSPPSKEEVAGAWGELYVLKMLIQSTQDPETQRLILAGWEGEIRDKLDFRFSYTLLALEIKTTMSNNRIHHFHGIEQVSIPDGYRYGILASLCVEVDEGITCLQLITQILSLTKGSEANKERFTELFDRRRVIRGPSCEDDRFVFQLARNGLSFYEFSNVPTPGEKEGVTPIEWLSDLKDIEQIPAVEIDSLLRKVTHPHQVLLE